MDKIKKTALAEKLICLRKQKGMTQNEIADMLNIKRSTYAYYERSTTPPVEMLRKIAHTFNISVDELVDTHTSYTALLQDKPVEKLVFRQPEPNYNMEFIDEAIIGDEKVLLNRYKSLSADDKSLVQDYVRKLFLATTTTNEQ